MIAGGQLVKISPLFTPSYFTKIDIKVKFDKVANSKKYNEKWPGSKHWDSYIESLSNS